MLDLTFTPLAWLVILAFAVFRVSWMFAREDGPFGVFAVVREKMRMGITNREPGKFGDFNWTLSELLNCPLCLGIWISVLALIAVTIPGIALRIIILLLAISGMQSFLTLLIIKDE